MEKLLVVADQQVSLSNSASSAVDFDENLFQLFMLKNPVWDFNGISRDDYLRKSKADKEQLLLNYYNQMKMGEQITFNIFLLSSKVSSKVSFCFFKLLLSKFTKYFKWCRLRNFAVTIVPLLCRYRKLEMGGTIFHYRQHFCLKKIPEKCFTQTKE